MMPRIMKVLSGPMMRSAKRAGMIRPGMPTALKIKRMVKLMDEEVWIILVAKILIYRS
jgi:hypothetical protein